MRWGSSGWSAVAGLNTIQQADRPLTLPSDVFSSLIPVVLRRRGPLAQAAEAVPNSSPVPKSSPVSTNRPVARVFSVASALAVTAALWPGVAVAQAMFGAGEMEPQRFVLVASPIGSSGRYQLNIYEQVNNRKPCFAIGAGKPAAVNPLLATFDFTGICSRYIDANGYSVRVGPSDLAGTYRLLVRSEAGDTLLIALPTKAGAGPEMVVAKAGGAATGFHKLDLEPGWRLMRRQFRGRNLGHVYLFSEVWPGVTSPAASPLSPPGLTPAPGPSSVPAAPSSLPVAPSRPAAVVAPKPVNGSAVPAPIPLQAAPIKTNPLPTALPKL